MVESLPFNASNLLGGTARPSFPDGEAGEVSVVQIGPLDADSGTLLFAFRNNTSDGISHVDWTATAPSGGSLVATGGSQGVAPAQIQPGEVGLAFIYFEGNSEVPDDADYEFSVSGSPVDTAPDNTAPLAVTEVSLVGDAIVGTATNGTGAETTSPYRITVYCFDGDNLVSQFTDFAKEKGDIAEGGTVTFSTRHKSGVCPSFVVGVSGYFS
ncbi:hypothetical protein ESZ53_05370 [Salinibacterium sp. UTAS2018]|uniref:hypothetical protein n=1 Tax=Salinibacterium sp. UTAS2018 TaxID=2508880 RepID=UPI0010095006|nr:hypothetical protein [Salinibacterium sp. UTAS2018]QAV69912.1 hypothetical protein ESZ53_05370 [Salinibacterium sp. UTAS2018]